jgi:hypothetical protein
MNPAKRIVRAIMSRMAADRGEVQALRASTRALARDVDRMSAAAAGLAAELAAVRVQMDRLAALHEGEREAAVRMDALERVLERDRIARHIRAAVAQATLVDGPAPHAVIASLLPADVYAALVEAIPAPVFFESSDAGGGELRLPLTLAPTHAVATWDFLAGIVAEVLVPALAERFQPALERRIAELCPSFAPTEHADISLVASPGRIIRRVPGWEAPPRRRPWHLMTAVVCLARPGEGPTANSALIVVHSPGALDGAVQRFGVPDVAQCAYEIQLGPDSATRRRLLALMDEATRRAWEA